MYLYEEVDDMCYAPHMHLEAADLWDECLQVRHHCRIVLRIVASDGKDALLNAVLDKALSHLLGQVYTRVCLVEPA